MESLGYTTKICKTWRMKPSGMIYVTAEILFWSLLQTKSPQHVDPMNVPQIKVYHGFPSKEIPKTEGRETQEEQEATRGSWPYYCKKLLSSDALVSFLDPFGWSSPPCFLQTVDGRLPRGTIFCPRGSGPRHERPLTSIEHEKQSDCIDLPLDCSGDIGRP